MAGPGSADPGMTAPGGAGPGGAGPGRAGAGATLSSRAGRLLLGVAVWNVVTYSIFIKNLYWAGPDEPDRPAGFYIAHTVLIIVNLAIAALLAPLGRRVVQAHKAARSAGAQPTPVRS